MTSTIDSLEKTCKWLKKYQSTGFADAVTAN